MEWKAHLEGDIFASVRGLKLSMITNHFSCPGMILQVGGGFDAQRSCFQGPEIWELNDCWLVVVSKMLIFFNSSAVGKNHILTKYVSIEVETSS